MRAARRVCAWAIAWVVAGAATALAASGWTIVPSASPGTSQSFLDGVGCAASTASASPPPCFGVGSFVTTTGTVRALIEEWDGTGWSVVPSPQQAGALVSGLVAVACPKPSSCVAVGSTRATAVSATVPLIEGWNGTRWKVLSTHAPASTTNAYLNSVSCTSSASCYAVGSYATKFSTPRPFVEHWNGAKWAIVKSANPPGAVTAGLSGVSCTGAGANLGCWAVGSYATKLGGDPFFTLTEHLQRGAWLVVKSPNDNHKSSTLNAVSCTGAKSCYAVGFFQHDFGSSLVEHWNGARWTIVPSANPPRATLSQLTSLSCTSATSCVAAGTYATGSPSASTLIERWNGAHWSIDASPDPDGAYSSSLAGVSCAVPTGCIAVGTYLNNTFGNPPVGFSEHQP